MKTYSIVAAAAVLSFAQTAFAQVQGEATYDYPQRTASVTARADVQADLVAARAAGQVVSGEASVQAPVRIAKQPLPTLAQRVLANAPAAGALPLNVEAISFDGTQRTRSAAPLRTVARS